MIGMAGYSSRVLGNHHFRSGPVHDCNQFRDQGGLVRRLQTLVVMRKLDDLVGAQGLSRGLELRGPDPGHLLP